MYDKREGNLIKQGFINGYQKGLLDAIEVINSKALGYISNKVIIDSFVTQVVSNLLKSKNGKKEI